MRTSDVGAELLIFAALLMLPNLDDPYLRDDEADTPLLAKNLLRFSVFDAGTPAARLPFVRLGLLPLPSMYLLGRRVDLSVADTMGENIGEPDRHVHQDGG